MKQFDEVEVRTTLSNGGVDGPKLARWTGGYRYLGPDEERPGYVYVVGQCYGQEATLRYRQRDVRPALNLGRLRRIANNWHEGTGPLTAFATSGAIVAGLSEEIEHCRAFALGTFSPVEALDREVRELEELASFVRCAGERGPVEGWHLLDFDK